MNSKERMHAALEGRPVDRMPVVTPYVQLYYEDHFSELTGKELWEVCRWLQGDDEEYLAIYRTIMEKVPFEVIVPYGGWCPHIEFVRKDGHMCQHDRRTDTYQPIDRKLPGEHVRDDYVANETQRVFNQEDVKKQVDIVKAETLLAQCGGRVRGLVRDFGKDNFVAVNSMVGILWSCAAYLGQTNMLSMLIEDPDLIRCLSDRLLEREIESIRMRCALGYDGIFIDDAMAYSDIISVEHYERFSLPYLKQMIAEIHRHNCKAILIYFGGVMDRLEQIASTGADGLLVETTMKNYVNDIEKIAETIGKRMTLFGNIDPIGVLQNGSDEQLAREIKRQAEAGKKCRGFIMCTGSPITPATPLARVQKFIELGRKISVS